MNMNNQTKMKIYQQIVSQLQMGEYQNDLRKPNFEAFRTFVNRVIAAAGKYEQT
jgi:hypothetical protein